MPLTTLSLSAATAPPFGFLVLGFAVLYKVHSKMAPDTHMQRPRLHARTCTAAHAQPQNSWHSEHLLQGHHPTTLGSIGKTNNPETLGPDHSINSPTSSHQKAHGAHCASHQIHRARVRPHTVQRSFEFDLFQTPLDQHETPSR